MHNKSINQKAHIFCTFCKKIPIAMRMTLLFLFLLVFHLQAEHSYSQNTKISLDMKNSSIERILQAIEERSEYYFLYNSKLIDVDRKTDIRAKEESIASVLNRLFGTENVAYEVKGTQIILHPKEMNRIARDLMAETLQQRKTISGRVTDNQGEPIIGANIIEKGTTYGTVTDVNGNFSLQVEDNTILQITYIGYLAQDINTTGSATFDIVLQEDTKALEEVVVTALGLKKETKALTYNVQELKGDEVLLVSDANFLNSLAGKVAGVTINSSSSGIGGSSKVVMRGTKSISGNNNALYVIDGIPMPSLATTQPSDLFTGMGQSGDGASNINPDDIESMSILTGPAAAALYGSEAANGVVLITTKQGNVEQPLSINYSNSTQFLSPFVKPKFQNKYGSDEGSYASWGEELATPSSYDPMDFFQTGYNVTNAFSLSTGTAKNKMYASFAALNAEGIIPNNELDRYNVSFNNSSLLFDDKLKLDFNVMYMSVKEQNMLAQGQYFNPLIPLYLFPRGDDITKYQTYERYNVERNFKTQYWPYGNMGLAMQNPYWIINRDMFENKKDRFLLGGGFKYNIIDGLNLSGRIKMDLNKLKTESKYYASTDGIFADKYGFYALGNGQTHQTYVDIMLNLDKYFGDFSLTATAGASSSEVKNDYSLIEADLNSVANLFSLSNLNLSQAKTTPSYYHDQLQAVFATAQLGYRSLVYLDVTTRNDWSSLLTNTDSKSIFYPSAGLSAILSDIFKINSSVLSFLKARVSYSEVGNAPQRYITKQYYSLVNGMPESSTFMFNDNLEPERTKSWETGLNVALWQRTITMGISLYKSSTENQLFMPTLPSSSGFNRIYVNAGKVENKGIELSLGFNQNIGEIDWSSTFTYSLNRNKIKQLLRNYKLPTGDVISMTEMNMGGTDSYRMELHEGGSMGDFYVTSLRTDEHGYILVDQNSQEVIADPNTFIYGGNVNPKYNMGLQNSFSWRGVNLGFLINARVGGEVTSVTQALMDAYGVSVASAEARDNGGAIVNGQKIPAQPYYQTIGGGRSGVGSMYVYSATNVRLAELSIGYDIPVTKVAPFIKGLNISFIGRNLFMFYNKAPFDPELTASTGTYYQGVDYFMAPSLRTLGFAVQLKF